MYYSKNIEEETLQNDNFRKVLYTDPNIQLVLMSLKPGENIGMEVHDHLDQFIRVEEGTGKALMNEEEFALSDGSVVIISKGVSHDIINTSETEDLKLYTLYAPPEHKDGVIHQTKKEAEESHEHYQG